MLRRIRPPFTTSVLLFLLVGVPAGRGERVREYARHVGGRDAAALVADAQGERGGLVDAGETRWGHDGDEHGREGVCAKGAAAAVLLVVVLDSRAEGVLEDLGEDVLHVHGDVAVFFGGLGFVGARRASIGYAGKRKRKGSGEGVDM